MKKSINGKSFDEIFSERGKKIKVEEMVKGNVYLFDKEDKYPWDWIAKFGGSSTNFEVVMYNTLCSDGTSYWIHEKIGENGCKKEDVTAYFEATPDQIELLNAYK